jgi:hypothetical protein
MTEKQKILNEFFKNTGRNGGNANTPKQRAARLANAKANTGKKYMTRRRKKEISQWLRKQS